MPRSLVLLGAYAFTLFLSATLLFLVQPMVGKLILPLFGGSPAVWNACMVFFQAVLLVGYAYAHFSTQWLGVRRQAVLHLAVLALPLIQLGLLGLGIDRGLLPGNETSRVLAVLFVLTMTVGLPFFAVSTTAPLLQRWFASTGHADARDPYFLYGASNVGSMLALLAYPMLMEPSLRLVEQRGLWVMGYTVLFVLVAGCAVLLWKSPVAAEHEPAADAAAVGDRPTFWRRLHWIALAFVPSSLLLGVTTYLTTDVAAIPLLWVLPLALYLLSFILVFSRLPRWVHQGMVLALPVLLLLLLFLMVSTIKPRIGATIGLHLALLFVVAMVCHGELAARRPPARYLTEFYLLMSLGGVLGGLFNALLAPLLFHDLYEYPLAMVLAALLLPDLGTTVFGSKKASVPIRSSWPRVLDFVLPALLGLAALALIVYLAESAYAWELIQKASRSMPMNATQLRLVLMYGLPIVLCYAFIDRPLRFGLGVAAFWLAAVGADVIGTQTVYQARSFFGVLSVQNLEEGADENKRIYHRLVHGTTVHGMQTWSPDGQLGEPLTYYGRPGPIGKVLAAWNDPRYNLGIIGLGTGSMAAYAQPGQQVTFYEIDPLVQRLAFDPKYFTYLHDARERGAALKLILGDARLEMDKQDLSPEDRYDVLVVDAFSSDAIPVHLITQEAVRLYFSRVSEHGIVAFHTSNRYLDLEPVLRNIADAEGYATLVGTDNSNDNGLFPTTWVLMARSSADFAPLLLGSPEGWAEAKYRPGVGVWTDDFSNVLSVFIWGD